MFTFLQIPAVLHIHGQIGEPEGARHCSVSGNAYRARSHTCVDLATHRDVLSSLIPKFFGKRRGFGCLGLYPRFVGRRELL